MILCSLLLELDYLGALNASSLPTLGFIEIAFLQLRPSYFVKLLGFKTAYCRSVDTLYRVDTPCQG